MSTRHPTQGLSRTTLTVSSELSEAAFVLPRPDIVIEANFDFETLRQTILELRLILGSKGDY